MILHSNFRFVCYDTLVNLDRWHSWTMDRKHLSFSITYCMETTSKTKGLVTLDAILYAIWHRLCRIKFGKKSPKHLQKVFFLAWKSFLSPESFSYRQKIAKRSPKIVSSRFFFSPESLFPRQKIAKKSPKGRQKLALVHFCATKKTLLLQKKPFCDQKNLFDHPN